MLFINYYRINQLLCIEDDIMHNCGNCIVIILVILYVVENHVSWCMNFGLVLVYSGSMVWIHEQVDGSRWESMKHY